MAKIKGNAGYAAIHMWVRKYKPKPELCEHCGEKEPEEVANISKKYKRDIKDYYWLCKSCHTKYDGVDKNLGDFLNGKKGKESPNWKGGKVKITCDECGKTKSKYPSHIKSEKVFCNFICANRYKYKKLKRNDYGQFQSNLL